MTRRPLLALLALGILLAGAWTLSTATPHSRAERAEPEALLPVKTSILQRINSFERSRMYAGTLVPRRESDLSFERSGRVVELFVDDGDVVQAGQTLARLDTKHLQTQRLTLQAQRDEAAAVLKELENGARQEVIDAARAQVQSHFAQLQLLETRLKRNRTLHQRKAIPKEELDDTGFEMDAAKARYEQSKHQLDELLAGTRKEKIDAQEAIVQRLDAQLSDIAIDFEDCLLKAPFDGRVSKRFVDEGVVVAPQFKVMRFIEHQALEARIGVPFDRIAQLRPGDEATLHIDDLTYPAKVKAIVPELDRTTRTQVVVFQLDPKTSAQLAAGQLVRIAVQETVDESGFWVPTTALARGTRGLWSVYVAETSESANQASVSRRDVELLYTEGDQALVRGTVQEGELVIWDGLHRIVPGQNVQLANRSSQRSDDPLSH